MAFTPIKGAFEGLATGSGFTEIEATPYSKTKLPEQKEQQFKKWYGEYAGRAGVSPNPDDPDLAYDYRGWFSKIQESPIDYAATIDPSTSAPVGPSQFKAPWHPQRFVGGVDTITGERVGPEQETPGLMTELGHSIARGAVSALPKMVGESLEFFDPEGGSSLMTDIGKRIVRYSEDVKNENPWLKESHAVTDAESPFNARTAVSQGGEMFAPSMGLPAVGAAVGAVAGPGGVAVGAGLGFLASMPIFFGSQAQNTFDRGYEVFKAEGLSDNEAFEKAREAAIKTGSIEAGGELIADIVTMKLFRFLPKPVKKSLMRSATKVVRSPMAMLKDFAKITATEASTEMGQIAGQMKVEADAGIGHEPTGRDVASVILPTAVMSVMTMGMGETFGTINRAKSMRLLKDGNADPSEREKIVKQIGTALFKEDQEVARGFISAAMVNINSKKPVIVIDDESYREVTGVDPSEEVNDPAEPVLATGAVTPPPTSNEEELPSEDVDDISLLAKIKKDKEGALPELELELSEKAPAAPVVKFKKEAVAPEETASEEAKKDGVKVFVTSKDKAALAGLNYSVAQVKEMKPEKAAEIISKGETYSLPDADMVLTSVRDGVELEQGQLDEAVLSGYVKIKDGKFTLLPKGRRHLAATKAANQEPIATQAIDDDIHADTASGSSNKIVSTGEEKPAFVPKGYSVPVAMGLAEADDLVTSNLPGGNLNPDYPAELQPRDRSRHASQGQIQQIASNLNPERLGESTMAGDGAPIVSPDGVVESGNGRVSAIRQAYRGEKGAEYKAHLTKAAKALGVDPESIAKMKNPVLVRVRKGDIDRAEFVKDANQPDIAPMSGAEQAKSDSARLTDEDMELFSPDESGNVLAASNEDFLLLFARKIGDLESGGLKTADGRWTKQMADRVTAAVFFKAYADENLLTLVAEEADPDSKNLLAGMTAAIGSFVNARAEGVSNDLAAHVASAVQFIRDAKHRGQPVEGMLAQQDALSERPPEVDAIVGWLNEFRRSGKRVGDFLKEVASEQAAAAAHAKTEDMFGAEPAPLNETIERGGQNVRPKQKEETPDAVGVDKQSGKESEGVKPEKPAEGVANKTVDDHAHEAATSKENDLDLPTEPQIESGSYKKGHPVINGVKISIENPAGSKRRPEWPTLKAHYGYVKDVPARAPDKEHVDVFVKKETDDDFSGDVFVIDQYHENGKFDEPKVMIGYADEVEAKAAYQENFTKDWKGGKATTKLTMDDFKDRLQDSAGFMKPIGEASQKASQGEAETQAGVDDKADKSKSKPAEPENADHQDLSSGYIKNHQAFMQALRAGDVFPEDISAHYDLISSQKDLAIAELAKLTKKDLLKKLGRMGAARYKNEKKGQVVEAAYMAMIDDMVLGDSISYVVGGKDSHNNAVKAMVDSYTGADIDKYAADYKAHLAAYKKRVEGFKKSLDNPETLEEFKTFVRANGEEALSPEQSVKFDQLKTDSGRESRQQVDERKASVAQVEIGKVGMEIVETEHTRDKYPLFVVKLSERVEKDTYKALAQSAKKLGGWYSRFNKNGAIPGFQFKSREAAERFVSLREGSVDGAEIIVEKVDTKKKSSANKLRALADRMAEKADESLSHERKTNTARRARMAASAEADAEANKAVGRTIARIADAYDSGEIKYLDKLSSKVQVETLDRVLAAAMHVRQREEGKSYSETEKEKGRPYDAGDIDYAKMPVPGSNRNMIESAALKLGDTAGAKQLSAKMLKLIKGKAEEGVVFTRQPDIDLFRLFSKKAGDLVGWYAEESLTRYDRMVRMGITNDAEMRSALREYIGYKQNAAATDPIKAKERELFGMKIPGFFPTPPAVIERMLEEAGIEPGMDVLEPSAGKGNIADAIKEVGVTPDVFEINHTLSKLLEAKGYEVKADDFTAFDSDKYDRIVMNPPFEKGQDIDHVRHAYSLLNPGGKVVSIMSEGPFFRRDKKATEFRAWLDGVGFSEKLPSGSFAGTNEVAQTGTATRLVVIEKAKSEHSIEEKGVRYGKPRAIQQNLSVADPKAENRVGSGQLSLFLDKKALVTKGQKNILFAENESVEVGRFSHGIEEVKNAGDAAAVVSPIRNHSQETLIALVLDSNKKPLQVIQHQVGDINSGGVNPGLLTGAIHSVPGAATAYIAHNHPSGNEALSSADEHTGRKLQRLMARTGVEVEGMLVLTPKGEWASWMDAETGRIQPDGEGKDTPVTQRRIKKLSSKEPITSPEAAINSIAGIGEDGVLYLDNSHRPVAFVSVNKEESDALRESGSAKRLFEGVHQGNATAAIISSQDGKSAQNVANFLRQSDVVLLDTIIPDGEGGYESLEASGMGPTGSSSEPYYSVGSRSGIGATVEEATAIIEKKIGKKALDTLLKDDLVIVASKEEAVADMRRRGSRYAENAGAMFSGGKQVEDFQLEQPTEEGLRELDQPIKEKPVGTEVEPADDFELTGSDLAADANPNQQPLFSRSVHSSHDLLKPIGESAAMGSESMLVDDGNYQAYESDYKSLTKRSVRYVALDDNGKIIGSLQINMNGPRTKKATIAMVYVDKKHRRSRVAAGLLHRARKDFTIKHSSDLTNDGKAFKKADGVMYSRAAESGYEGTNKGEAAEWLAAKAKGLDMSLESRMARAESMGFDVLNKWFHGTNTGDIEAFKPSKARHGRNYTFFTPDTAFASVFTNRTPEASESKSPTTYPVMLKTGKLFNPLDWGKRESAAFKKALTEELIKTGSDKAVAIIQTKNMVDEMSDYESPSNWEVVESLPVQAAIKSIGYDSFVVKEADVLNVAIYDPARVRSIHAAFNPAEIDSDNLLSSKQEASGDNVKGLYDDSTDTSYIITGSLESAEEAWPIFTHEVGTHYGLERILGEPKYNSLIEDVEIMVRGGSHAILKAMRHVNSVEGLNFDAESRTFRADYADNMIGNHRITQETIAYLAQNNADLPLMKRIFAAVKAFLRKMGIKAKLTEEDVAAIVVAAAKSADSVARNKAAYRQGLPQVASQPLFSQSSREYTSEQAAVKKKGGFGVRKKTSFKDRYNESKYRAGTKIRQGLVDKYASFQAVLGDNRAWMMGHLTSSHNGALEAIMQFGSLYLQDNAIAVDANNKGLEEALAPLGEELDDWLMWIAGNRAEMLSKEGRERLFNKTDIAALKSLADGKLADGRQRSVVYESVRQDFELLNRSVVDIAVATGLVNEEEAKAWAEQGFYLPFYRMVEEEELARGPRAFGNGLVRQTAYKKLKGADMQVDDLLTNLLMNWNHLLGSSLRNQAGVAALDSAVEIGLAEEITQQRKGKNSVFVRKNGKETWYDVADGQDGALVLTSLLSLNQGAINGNAMKLMRKFKRALTIGVTASPEFKAANLFRDTIQAAAVAQMSPNIAKNLVKGFAGTKKGSNTINQMIAGGGAFGDSGYIHGADPDAVRMLVNKGISRDSILTPKFLTAAWDKWQDLGARLENVNRAANFEHALEEGKDLLTANFESRDHLDFSRTGTWLAVRTLAQIVPFLNARMQGIDKLNRAAIDNNQRAQFVSVVAAYTAASVLLYLTMKDDDDYKEAEEWERNTYHLFKVPGSDIMLRLPRPFEVGAIASLGERFVEQLVDDKAHGALFFESLWFTLTETFAFDPTPQMFKPGLEIYANRNSFTQRPIESMAMKNLSPTERKRAWTSQLAVGASEAMDTVSWGEVVLSPVQIQHLVRGYLGWLGETALNGSDAILRIGQDLPERPAMKPTELPLIKRFAREGKGRSSKYMTIFYDRLEESRLKHGDMRAATNNGDAKKRAKILDESKGALLVFPMLSKVQRNMAKQRKQINYIYINKKMSAKDKRKRIDDINERMHGMAKIAVERSNSAFRPSARKSALSKAIQGGTNDDARKAVSDIVKSGRADPAKEIKSAVTGTATPRLDRIIESAPKELRDKILQLSEDAN